MTQSTTRTIRVAGREITIPLVTHRKLQVMLDRGNKIDAVVVMRKLAKVQLKPAKAAVEDPANFDQPDGRSASRGGGMDIIAELRRLVTGEVKPRQWMVLHPHMAGGFGVALIALSLMIATAVAWDSPAYTRHQRVWYYDIDSRELFERMYEGSPIKGLKGEHEGAVRAYVYACESCGSDSFIGFVEKFSDDAMRVQQRLREGGEIEDEAAVLETLTAGHRVRAKDDVNWVGFDEKAGQVLRQAVVDRCEGNRPIACLP